MPSIRLLDLTNLVALSPAKHFFNGLLAGFRPGVGTDSRYGMLRQGVRFAVAYQSESRPGGPLNAIHIRAQPAD